MKSVTMIATTPGSPNGIEVNTYEAGQTYDLPDELADTFLADKTAKLAQGDGQEEAEENLTWPPTDEQIDEAGHDDLGALLTSQGVDPAPLKSKDARRGAIRDLIAKQKAEAGQGQGDGQGAGDGAGAGGAGQGNTGQ